MSHELREGRAGHARRTVRVVTLTMALLSILCVVVMMLATVADVSRRTVSGEPIQGVVELGEVLMVAIVFLGLPYAESRKAHVSMTILVSRLPTRVAAAATCVGLALVVLVVAWMVVVTGERALVSLESQEYRFGLVKIPVWPARLALFVGLVAFLAELLLRFVDSLRAARRRGPGDDRTPPNPAPSGAPVTTRRDG